MPRMNSPQKYRTILLHGREQTPFGSQTPFSWKGRRTAGLKAGNLGTTSFEISVSVSGCQGTKLQKFRFTSFVRKCCFKLSLEEFVYRRPRLPLTPPSPGETIVQGMFHVTCPF